MPASCCDVQSLKPQQHAMSRRGTWGDGHLKHAGWVPRQQTSKSSRPACAMWLSQPATFRIVHGPHPAAPVLFCAPHERIVLLFLKARTGLQLPAVASPVDRAGTYFSVCK